MVEIETFGKVGYTTNGNYIQSMPALKEAGYSSEDMIFVMAKRIEAIKSGNKKQIAFWLNDNYFDTPCPVARHKGKLAVSSYASNMLLGVNEDTVLNKSGLIGLDGKSFEEISKEKGSKIITIAEYESDLNNRFTSLSKASAFYNSIYSTLSDKKKIKINYRKAGEEKLIVKELTEKEVLNEYISSMFDCVKEKYGEDAALGYFIQDADGVGALVLDRSGGRFGCNSRDGLGDDARLVGVRPDNAEGVAQKIDGQVSKIKGLEEILSAIQSGKTFEYGELVYAPIQKDAFKK